MLKTNFQAFQQCITLITSEKQSNVATGRRSDIWEKGNQTTVPSWLSGIYVRNGPAQVSSEIMSLSLEMNDPSRGTNYNLILHFSIHLVLPENIWVVGWMDLPNFTVLSLMAQMFITVVK